ncbi:uncharacterized protein GGS22DRAFT_163593 [Annulohypoxylon maeteangense]|uniref:uncharacterized protein n=1 Tax=Annulohypoxylon maeteangense TaxID=1927788 RepID=UPI002008C2AC|nr:uncharacterized protein GGS22DRAFT_163593 [Annulohypoxylon maeteangense]KAI0885389.1 hypothetical protein GGS22DRAFT_163593 [Annulohypoxylon maeteangense]
MITMLTMQPSLSFSTARSVILLSFFSLSTLGPMGATLGNVGYRKLHILCGTSHSICVGGEDVFLKQTRRSTRLETNEPSCPTRRGAAVCTVQYIHTYMRTLYLLYLSSLYKCKCIRIT